MENEDFENLYYFDDGDFEYNTVEELLNSEEFKENLLEEFEDEEFKVETEVMGNILKYIITFKISLGSMSEDEKNELRILDDKDVEEFKETYKTMYDYIKDIVSRNAEDFKMECVFLDIDGFEISSVSFTVDDIR